MTRLCECGCGQPTPLASVTRIKNGWVKGEPLRFVHGHRQRLQGRNLRGRLLSRVVIDLDGPRLEKPRLAAYPAYPTAGAGRYERTRDGLSHRQFLAMRRTDAELEAALAEALAALKRQREAS